jgi:hypothetical protein
MVSSRRLVALLAALILAAGPILGAISSAPAAEPHGAMAMTAGGGDHGCCSEDDSNTAALCFAHCAAGVIDTSPAALPAPAVTASAVPAFVRRVDSRAPPPETTPPKSSAA